MTDLDGTRGFLRPPLRAASALLHASVMRWAAVGLAVAVAALAGPVVAQQPRIDSIAPAQGPISGGTTVTVSGSALARARVKLDGAVVTPLAQTETEIRLQMPAHDNGYAIIAAVDESGAGYARYLYVPPRLYDLPPGSITTVAGVGPYNGQYGPATQAPLGQPWGLMFSPSGLLYFTDTPNNRVMRIRADGVLEPVAGNGLTQVEHPSGPVPATSISIAFPRSIAFDSGGNLFVPDSGYYIWRVDPNGMAEPIAGNGTESFSAPEGVPAKGTPIGHPAYVVVDRDDNLYFSDFTNARIRKIDRNGIITTYAGNGTYGFSGDGGAATSAQFNIDFVDNGGLAFDSADNLYLLDYGNKRIRRIVKATGVIETFAGPTLGTSTFNDLRAITIDSADALYIAEAALILKRAADGSVTRISSGQPGFSEDGTRLPNGRIGIVKGLVADRRGDLLYSDDQVRRVRSIDHVTGALATLAGIGPRNLGEGEAAISAALTIPNLDLEFLHDGSLLVGESDRIYAIGSDGILTRFAGSGVFSPFEGVDKLQATVIPVSLSVSADGTVDYVGGSALFRIDTDNVVRRTAAKFAPCSFSGDGSDALNATTCQPWDAVRDSTGNLVFADTNNNRIRRVDRQSGIITTIAGSGTPNGLERYGAGTSCGDGGPAAAACINTPYGLAFDEIGNLYVCENELRIRKIDRQGTISTFAEVRCTKPTWAFGYLYSVAQDHVARISPAGTMTQLTQRGLGFSGDGGPASAARIRAQKQSHGVAVNGDGDLFFVDGDNKRVRAIRYGAVLAPAGATISASVTRSLLQATVRDASGQPAPSVRVEFAAPASGASCTLTPAFAITDAAGVATVSCTPNCIEGTYDVTARPVNAATTSATVQLTNPAGPCRRRVVRH